MTVIWADNFARANSASALGTPTTGGPYTVVAGTWGINGEAAYISATTNPSVVTVPASADFQAQFTRATAISNVNAGLVFRYSDASNYWWCSLRSDYALLYKRQVGVDTLVLMSNETGQNGDVLAIQADGNRISMKKNGRLLGTVVDSFNASAAVGGMKIDGNVGPRIDDVTWDDTVTPWAVSGFDGVGLDFDDVIAEGTIVTVPYAYLGRDSVDLDYEGAP